MKQPTKEFTPRLIVLSVIVLLLSGGLYTTYFFKEEVLNQQKEKLLTELHLIKPYVLADGQVNFDVSRLDKGISEDERLSILDAQGNILYDSSHKNLAKGTREKRPEIRMILEEHKEVGYAVRDSQTIGEKSIYVAIAMYVDSELVGILRLSETYTGISAHLKEFQRNLFGVFFIFLVAILLMYVYIIRQSRKPIQFILPILRNAIKSPDKKQQVVDAPQEWQELYQTVYELMDETNQLYDKQSKNEATLQFLFDNLNIGIFILNKELEVVLANNMTERLFKPHTIPEHYESWFRSHKMSRFINQAVEDQADVQGEMTLKEPKNRYLNVVIRLLESDDVEYVGIIYDITEIRAIETVHEDFISNISHELKTPTTSIIGFAETLLSGAKDDPEASTEFLSIIESEGQRLLSLIQNIMMLLKTEKDIYLLDTVSVNPVQVIEDELHHYRYKMEKKKLQMTFDVSVSHKINLPGNSFQLIAKNLIENAVEYTEECDSLFIYLTEQDNHLVLTVEDTGVGIAEEDKQRIFERFYRVSQSRQRNTGGSGLGLSIVEHYTHILGGTIKLISDLDEGTTVIVKLPFENKE